MVGFAASCRTRLVVAALSGCVAIVLIGSTGVPTELSCCRGVPVQAQEATSPLSEPLGGNMEELLGPSVMTQALTFLHYLYDLMRSGIVFVLEETVFRENEKLADFYGDVVSFLVSLTVIYLLLLLVNSAKKIIGVILFLGWALFIVALVVHV